MRWRKKTMAYWILSISKSLGEFSRKNQTDIEVMSFKEGMVFVKFPANGYSEDLHMRAQYHIDEYFEGVAIFLS